MKSQMATAMYEIYVHQEWARANDLTGTIKLSEYLMGTTRDRTPVDSGEGTYVWSACTEVESRCSPTQQLPSRMAQPSKPADIRTRSLVWS